MRTLFALALRVDKQVAVFNHNSVVQLTHQLFLSSDQGVSEFGKGHTKDNCKCSEFNMICYWEKTTSNQFPENDIWDDMGLNSQDPSAVPNPSPFLVLQACPPWSSWDVFPWQGLSFYLTGGSQCFSGGQPYFLWKISRTSPQGPRWSYRLWLDQGSVGFHQSFSSTAQHPFFSLGIQSRPDLPFWWGLPTAGYSTQPQGLQRIFGRTDITFWQQQHCRSA